LFKESITKSKQKTGNDINYIIFLAKKSPLWIHKGIKYTLGYIICV
jgi:hypothetical protein